MSYVDFSEVKAQVSLLQVADALHIKLKPSAGQFRGPCPICNCDKPRVFALTPGKGWYSFCCKTGGDQIELAAKVMKCSQREAAIWLASKFGIKSKRKWWKLWKRY